MAAWRVFSGWLEGVGRLALGWLTEGCVEASRECVVATWRIWETVWKVREAA